MEQFYSLYTFSFSTLSKEKDAFYDIIGKLPLEIAIMTLRLLDSRTLLSAAMVNKKWLSLCRADLILCKRIREQILLEKRERLNPFVVIVDRSSLKKLQPLATSNGQHKMSVSYVSDIIRREPLEIRPPIIRRISDKVSAHVQGIVKKKKLFKAASKSTKVSIASKSTKVSIAKTMRL